MEYGGRYKNIVKMLEVNFNDWREKMERSKDFYIRVKGDYALFVDPSTKGGGEKVSYPICTKQALIGIVDSCYFKPTFVNNVEAVKIINPIKTHVKGIRALLDKYGADLNYYSYLVDVEYLVKFHFKWNESRKDLINDRNMKKHESIMERSIKKGGRRDIFLGTRECVGYIEEVTEEEFLNTESYYNNSKMSLGIMFNQFKYPTNSKEKLIAYYSETLMNNGVVTFKDIDKCNIYNEVKDYKFKMTKSIKSVDQEMEEYDSWEDGSR